MSNLDWLQEGADYVGYDGNFSFLPFLFQGIFEPVPALTPNYNDTYAPLWQVSPVVRYHRVINADTFSFSSVPKVFERMAKAGEPVLSEPINLEPLLGTPESIMLAPIYDNVGKNKNIVAFIIAMLRWQDYFFHLVPEGIEKLIVVVRNPCVPDTTFIVDGPRAEFVGVGDLHETKYDHLEVSANFDIFESIKECSNTIHVFPTTDFEEYYVTNKPVIYSVSAVSILLLTALVFVIYDCLVQYRQAKVMTTATRSNAIVRSLFPSTVHDRLMKQAITTDTEQPEKRNRLLVMNPFATDPKVSPQASAAAMDILSSSQVENADEPIADLFPHVTVLFGDIAGFTSWSSQREPSQVFVLLESIYNAFDKIARRRKVFKVESIGDCYMAAAGLPTPQADHSLVMAKFARECLFAMSRVVKHLEVTLGPDTAELGMRFGLHSGQVTAGVLRGERSRFQLFGGMLQHSVLS